jgi:hypothetical protein
MTINITALAEIVVTQITSIHASIMSREEGQQCPTVQEVNMEVRLINSLDKLRKLAIFFAKQDAAATTPAPAPVAHTGPLPSGAKWDTDIPKKYHGLGDPPPFDNNEFNDVYNHLLADYDNVPEDSTITFRGTTVSRWWLIYNLFQNCVEENCYYIQDERRFRQMIDIHKLKQSMDRHFHRRAA